MIEKSYTDWVSFRDEMVGRSATATLQYEFLETPNRYYITWKDGGLVSASLILLQEDASDFETNYQTGANQSAQPSKVSQQLEAAGSSVWFTSHDFCAPETWGQRSVVVTDEVLVGMNTVWKTQPLQDNGIPLYLTSTEKIIINFQDGLMLNEDDITSSPNALYQPEIGVDQRWDLTRWFPSGHNLIPVLKDYQDNVLTRVFDIPSAGEWQLITDANGDQTIVTGDNWLTNAPKLSYNYATTSEYDMWAAPGKKYLINRAEVNSRNADWDDKHFWFQVMVANGAYVGARRIYKSESDVISASIDAPGVWRDWDILTWRYDEAGSPIEDVRIPIKNSSSMGLRLHIPQHLPYAKYNGAGRRPKVIITVYAVSFTEGV